MEADHSGPGTDAEAAEQLTDPVTVGLRRLAAQRSHRFQSIGSMVYETLREAILDGTLRPGLKLRQEILAEMIGVSRVPVRSALIQLESDGLVEVRGRRGAVVRALTADQVRQIYDIRAVLESHAMRLSMATMTEERVRRLRELAQLVDAKTDGTGFINARWDFYAELYDAAHQPMLWDLIEQLRLKVGRYLQGWRLRGSAGHSHEGLLDAVSRGDVEQAVNDIRHHLDVVRNGVLEKLERDMRDE